MVCKFPKNSSKGYFKTLLSPGGGCDGSLVEAFNTIIAEGSEGFFKYQLIASILNFGEFNIVIKNTTEEENPFTPANRIKARNAKREHDYNRIALALGFYYADNGEYPGGGLDGFDTCLGKWSGTFEADLSPYSSSMPVDPSNILGGDCTTNSYYAFENPVTWNLGPNCPIGTTVLYGKIFGDPTNTFRDDCNNGLNSIIFK